MSLRITSIQDTRQKIKFLIVVVSLFQGMKLSVSAGWALVAILTLLPTVLVIEAFSSKSPPGQAFGSGNFRIENAADGLDLTIQGVNASFATVVTDTWQNFKEQKWAMKKISFTSGYQLHPATYAVNNILSFYKDPLRKYPSPETWIFKEVKNSGKGTGLFQLVNERTTYCLTSSGRRRPVSELKCDIYQRTQHWKVMKV